MYSVIFFSSIPNAETKYPGDHTVLSFQYTFFNQPDFFLRLLLVMPLIRPVTSLAAYFGGMIITIYLWSTRILYSIISQPGILFITLGKACLNNLLSQDSECGSDILISKQCDALYDKLHARITVFPCTKPIVSPPVHSPTGSTCGTLPLYLKSLIW